MYELKKEFGKVFTSKSVGTGPSSYKKRIYRAAVSQRLRNTAIEDYCHQMKRVIGCSVLECTKKHSACMVSGSWQS